jgi:hypothetical protein
MRPADETDTDMVDHAALRLMLAYVEAECLRIGASEAARHTALAAALLPIPQEAVAAPVPAAKSPAPKPSATAASNSAYAATRTGDAAIRRPRGARLH